MTGLGLMVMAALLTTAALWVWRKNGVAPAG
jgi:hypothetical protein